MALTLTPLTQSATPKTFSADEIGSQSQALVEDCGVSIRFVGNAGGCSNSSGTVDLFVDYWVNTQAYTNYVVYIDITNGGDYSTTLDAFYLDGGRYGGMYRESDWSVVHDGSWGRGVYKAFITVRNRITNGLVCTSQSQINY